MTSGLDYRANRHPGRKVKVLDHGYVRLIDAMGTDESIVEAARMSTGRGFISWSPYVRCKKCQACWWQQDTPRPLVGLLPGFECKACCDNVPFDQVQWEKFPNGDLGLLTSLYRDGHSTPFEMSECAFEIQAPIMVFREWHRHRTQAYSEFSARYAQMPDLHYLPALERFQKQSISNKQGSAEVLPPDIADVYRTEFEGQQEEIYAHYDNLVTHGLAKEVARLNTPVSRYSKMRAKTDLRNWFGFLNLRMRPNAQWEIRQFANAVAETIKELWPKSYALFEEYDLNGVRLSATEAKLAADTMKCLDADGPRSTEGHALIKKLQGGKP